MSKEHKGKRAISRKAVITTAIVVGVALVALGVGLFASWLLQSGSTPGGNESNSGNDQSGLIGLPQNPQLKAVTDAQKAVDQGDYTKAQNTLDTALKTTTSTDDKFDLYLEKGVSYENEQKYNDAITAYQQAAAAKSLPSAYQAIARVATLIGNKRLAIDSYNKAISLLDLNDARSASLKQTLEEQIQELSQ